MTETPLTCTSKLTVEEFKSSFAFGIPLQNGATGEEMSDEAIQNFIDISYQYLELLYDIVILPKFIEGEHQDFYMDQAGRSYFMVHSGKVPLLFDEKNRDRYPLDVHAFYGAGMQSTLFPREWLRVNNNAGSIHVYPTFGSMGSFLMQFTALSFSIGTFRSEYIPQYYELSYCAGFDPIPKYINSVVGKLAYCYIANILGDSLLGAGIAGYSLSIDGLSQSISTTQSAMYGAYSARTQQYQKELEQEMTLLRAKFGVINLAGI